MKKFRLFF